jgi:hypothetical protein
MNRGKAKDKRLFLAKTFRKVILLILLLQVAAYIINIIQCLLTSKSKTERILQA